MIWTSTRLVVMAATGLFAAWCACCLWHMACRTAHGISRMRRQVVLALGVVAAVCCVEAQKRGGATGQFGAEKIPAVDAGNTVLGGQPTLSCLSAATKDGLPSLNARGIQDTSNLRDVFGDAWRMSRNWNCRGASDDSFWLSFEDGFTFPYGNGHLAGVELLACGELWPDPFDTNAVVRLPHALSIIAGQSSFLLDHTPSNTYLMAWDDCHVCGTSNDWVSASIELFRNGDILMTYDGETTYMPRILPFPEVGIGQDADWVYSHFTNAAEILDAGYPQWVDGQVGCNQTNGLYKLTVSFAEAPPEAALLTLGGMSVVVANPGDYVFLLKKGVAYDGQIAPACDGVTVSGVDDAAPPLRSGPVRSAGQGGSWSVDGGWSEFSYSRGSGSIHALWMPWFRGSPGMVAAHFGPGSSLPLLTAMLEDYAGPAVPFTWTSGDVVFSSPNGQTTHATIVNMPGWGVMSIEVTTTIEGFELHSQLQGVSYGEHVSPEVACGISLQPYLIRRDLWMEGSESALMTVFFTSDIPTNGHFRVWVANGGDKVQPSSSLPSYDIVYSTGEMFVCGMDGIEASDDGNDVVVCCTVTDQSGGLIVSNSVATTVVAPTQVSVPSAPETGLAVLIGSQVAVSLFPGVLMNGTIPAEWYTARRKTAVDYDSWLLKGAGMADMTLTMDQAGIFALKARAICVCQSNEVEYVHMNSEPAVLGIDDELGPNEAGSRNHIGVASSSRLLSIRNHALYRLNNVAYTLEGVLLPRNGFSHVGSNIWKCNAFVADMAMEAGVQVPVVHVIDHSILPEGRFPPTANEWATGSIPIAGWVHLGLTCYPEPGMIAGHPNPGGMGHCGIVDYDGWTISAREHGITRKAKQMLDGTTGYNTPMQENPNEN